MKAINDELAKLNKQYQQMISDYTMKIFNEKIIPVCLEEGLSYCTMNGFPQFYNKDGIRQPMPKKLYRIFEDCHTKEGDPLHFYFVEDFNPFDQNFSKLDIDNHKNKYKDITIDESILSCWQALHGIG